MFPTTPTVTLLLAHASSIAAANRHGETSPAERLRCSRARQLMAIKYRDVEHAE
jgi:hypothetical protein